MPGILTKEIMLTLIANMTFYFAIGTFGAFTKDLYDNIVNGKKRIELQRIFISAISTAFIFVGSQEYISKYLSFNTIVLTGFLCGVIGFELFGYLSSMKGLKTILVEALRIKKALEIGLSITKNTDNNISDSAIDTASINTSPHENSDDTIKKVQCDVTDNADLLSQVIDGYTDKKN